MQCFPTLRKRKGSVLVFSLIILSFMLVSALSVAVISVTEKRASLATDKSSRAFQVADTGVEVVLEKIYKGNSPTLSALGESLGGSCNNGDVSGGSPDYVVSFYRSDGTKLTDCSDTNWRSEVVKIKSEGTAGNTRRAVEVGIESNVCLVSSVIDADNNSYDTVAIGTQCWMKQNMQVGNLINMSSSQTNASGNEKYCFSNSLPNCMTIPHPTLPDGGLYQWNEAMQYSVTPRARGICPSGWHIPDDDEWYTLENYLKDTSGTCSATRNGVGCSSAGDKLKPGGMSGFEWNLAGYVVSSVMNRYGVDGFYWSSSESSGTEARYRAITAPDSGVSRSTYDKSGAFSVRCIQD